MPRKALRFPKRKQLMRQIINITSEKDLTGLYAKKKKGSFFILYTSLWDGACQRLQAQVDKWREHEGEETLYIINSWDMPAAFSMFMITSAPSLVSVKKGKVKVNVEFPTIYRFFDVSGE